MDDVDDTGVVGNARTLGNETGMQNAQLPWGTATVNPFLLVLKHKSGFGLWILDGDDDDSKEKQPAASASHVNVNVASDTAVREALFSLDTPYQADVSEGADVRGYATRSNAR